MIAVSHTLCEYAAGPKNSGDTGVPPLTDGVVADPEKYVLPRMYYPAEFVPFSSNGTSVITEIRPRPKKMIPCVPSFAVDHYNQHGSTGYL